MSCLINVSRTACALVLAISLALLSVHVERAGPELVQYGDAIFKPVLRGGFPVAYLFDAPGVSRERQLAFGEDKLSVDALIIDIAFYFAVILLVAALVSHYWSAYKKSISRPVS